MPASPAHNQSLMTRIANFTCLPNVQDFLQKFECGMDGLPHTVRDGVLSGVAD